MNKSHQFYFEMKEDELEQFVDALKTIKIGDSYEQILERLGLPYYDHIIAPKKPGSAPVGRMLNYNVKKLRRKGVNEGYDKGVSLIFDINDNLESVEFFPEKWLDLGIDCTTAPMPPTN